MKHIFVHSKGAPSDVKRDRGTTVNSDIPRQSSRSSSGLFREVIRNRDSKDLSSLNWANQPLTFFFIILSWVLKVFNFLFVIVDQIDSSPCSLVRTKSW